MSVLSDKVISVWSMDESGTSATRSDGKASNDMVPKDGGYANNQGKKGRLFRASNWIDTNTDWLEAADAAALSPSGDMAISAWVYFAESPPADPTVGRIIGKWDGTNNEYRIYFNVYKLHFDFQEGSGGTWFSVDSTTTLAKATWHHIVVNVDLTAETIDVWINGQLDQSFAGPDVAVDDTTAVLTIGGINGTAGDVGEHHVGLIDETAIYSSTLLESEIAALRGAIGSLAAVGRAYPRYVRLESSLAALWHFEDLVSIAFTPGSPAPDFTDNVGYSFASTAPAMNGKYATEDGVGLNRMYRLSHSDLVFLDDMGIAVWVYFDDTAPLPQTIVWKGDDGGIDTFEWHLWIDAASKANFGRTQDGALLQSVTSSVALITGQWNLIVATHGPGGDSSDPDANGHLQISVTPNTLSTVSPFDSENYDQEVYNSAHDLIAGAKWDNGSSTYTEIFRGRMDELMLWCRQLDTNDLERLYCFGNSGQHGAFYTGFKCAFGESVAMNHQAAASSTPGGTVQANVNLSHRGAVSAASVASMTVPITLAGASGISGTGGFVDNQSITFAANATFTQTHIYAVNVALAFAATAVLTPADQVDSNPSVTLAINHAMRATGGFVVDESTVSLNASGAITTAVQRGVPGVVTIAGAHGVVAVPGQTVDVAVTLVQQVAILGDGRLAATEVCFTDEHLTTSSAVNEQLKTARFDTESLVWSKMDNESLDVCSN